MRRRIQRHKVSLRHYLDNWAIHRLQYQPERNPKIIAILICMGLNLIPTALGIQPLPGSLQKHIYIGMFATSSTVVGSLMCVVGLIMPRRWRDAGLAVEIGGCVLLALGMFAYSYALFLYTQADQRAFAFGESFGIAIGCVLRFGQISLYVRGRRLASEEQARNVS